MNVRDLYFEFSQTDGQTTLPRLFLNGIGMTASHWRPVIENLPPGQNILHDFKDQLRSGKSAEPYAMESHAHELAELFQIHGIQQVDCIGTSYGSEVALLFALEYPYLVRSLVLIDGVSYSDSILKAAVESWKFAALADPRVFYKSLIPWNYSSEYISNHKDDLNQREEGVVGLPKAFFDGFARLCDSFLNFSITDRLAEIACPTLILVGEKDILKTPHYSRLMHQKIEGSQFVIIPGAGHAVVIENPEKISKEITQFYSAIF